MQYRKAALGGTFDRFHRGHQQLIQTALKSADEIVIGVTAKPLIKNKTLSELIEPYDLRVQNVIQELKSLNSETRAEIVTLTDPFGPTLSDSAIDVLIVSTETKPGGAYINQTRLQQKIPVLPIIEAEMIRDETGRHISSTLIRQGHGTRSGRVYQTLFSSDVKFSKQSLELLKSPQGKLLTSTQITPKLLSQFVAIYLVGDIVSQFFIENSFPFNLSIIDGHTSRGKQVVHDPNVHQLSLSNPPGMIKKEVASQIISSMENADATTIMINGEEDLLAFIPSLLGPLKSAVFYGQPGEGIVMIELREAVKVRLAQMIDPTFK